MRLPDLTPGELTPEQSALRAAILDGPRGRAPQLFDLVDDEGHLTGPFGIMLHSPAVGTALQGLGAVLRYGTELTDRVRETVVLAVAGHWASEFELYAHRPIARQAGLSQEQVTAVVEGAAVPGLEPAESAVLAVVRVVLSDGDLDDQQYEQARKQLGERGLVEVTALVGYYSLLAMQLRVFRVGVPDGHSGPASRPDRRP